MNEQKIVDMFFYKATVVNVYDGDSFRANIDLGFNMILANEPIRLYGVNTPEIRGDTREDGLKARDHIMSRIPVGSTIFLATQKDPTSKYGRYLATVYYINQFTPYQLEMFSEDGAVEGDGELISLNDELLDLELGTEIFYD